MAVVPLMYIGSGILLVLWIGPEGLIALSAPLFVFPLLAVIGKWKKKFLEKLNTQKDERARVTTDTVSILKQLKMYVW